MVKLIKINVTGEHQESGCDQVLASPCGASKPATGDDAGALGSDVVAALRYLADVIN
jgi:hypothetical protein